MRPYKGFGQNEKEATIMPKFKEGDIVIYKNGESYELGEVKRVCEKEKGEEQCYFVLYSTGDTAARTPESCLRKIRNAYAYDIERKHAE